MPMPMMQIRIVRMAMAKRLVPMRMRVWLGHWPFMGMLVVLVMDVPMLMFQRLVGVLVAVALGCVQP